MPAPLAIGSLVLGGIQAVGGLIGALSMGRRPRFTEDPRFAQAAGRAEYMAGMVTLRRRGQLSRVILPRRLLGIIGGGLICLVAIWLGLWPG